MRISLSPEPKRDALSPATAMMRYVVSDSGSVTSSCACRSRRSRPIRARTRARGSPCAACPAPASRAAAAAFAAPFGVSTRRLMMRWRVSSFRTCSALSHDRRIEDVGRLVAGQREHAVVDGPQRDFARGAAALPIVDVDLDLRAFAPGGTPRLFAFTATVSRLRRVFDLQLHVAEPERRLARIAGVVGRAVRRGRRLRPSCAL